MSTRALALATIANAERRTRLAWWERRILVTRTKIFDAPYVIIGITGGETLERLDAIAVEIPHPPYQVYAYFLEDRDLHEWLAAGAPLDL